MYIRNTKALFVLFSLSRRTPIPDSEPAPVSDTASLEAPTGPMRQIQCKLVKGEASRKLHVVDLTEHKLN